MSDEIQKMRNFIPKNRAIVTPANSELHGIAHFITDRRADDVQINTALEWARTLGDGEVLLANGEYFFENPMNVNGFKTIPHALGTLFTVIAR